MRDFSWKAKEYARELLKLHHLFANDQDGSEKGEQIRHRLEVLQDEMPADDWEHMNNLAGDIYMMSGEDMYCHVKDAKERQRKRVLLFKAIAEEDWVAVIKLLTNALRLPRAVVAHYRSRAYAAFPEISAMFKELLTKS